MIEDLLDMSRIEAGKVSLDIQRVDLPAVVAAGIETVSPAAKAKEIRLTAAFGSVNGIVMGDRDRLQQVVWNLMTNAIKFTPKNGRIHVVIKRANSHVENCVSDTGQGIAPEFLGQVVRSVSPGRRDNNAPSWRPRSRLNYCETFNRTTRWNGACGK